ncbi:MAG: S-methyl-5-thioribose-1-phosphate isomerase [Ignavibacteria bacterium]
MLIKGKHYNSIWIDKKKPYLVRAINQQVLPHRFEIITLSTVNEVIDAIITMKLRGAPLIGVAAAFGVYLAALEAEKKYKNCSTYNSYIERQIERLANTRPTAINLFKALQEAKDIVIRETTISRKKEAAKLYALSLFNMELERSKKIGEFGLKILKQYAKKKNNECLNILTHCNAGWLACIDYGTATAPIYFASKEGIKLHVWVEETRPRNQGSLLTSWEFLNNGIPHTIITDNAGGYVMEKGMVDIVIVGADRVSINGDVCNKVGTYKTALAAKDNNIPFFVALPTSSIDMNITNPYSQIPIEIRSPREVKYIYGLYKKQIVEVLITPAKSPAVNYAFDITPSRLITGWITEKGIIPHFRHIQNLIDKFY